MNAAHTNRKTILLVEDDPSAIAFATEAVARSQTQIELVVVDDSVEALSWLAQHAHEKQQMPNMILLDLKLPKLTGLAVLRTLRMDTANTDIPIVVFSELSEQADVLLSYQIGANSFVNKPTDIEQFKILIEELSAYWLERPRQRELAVAQ